MLILIQNTQTLQLNTINIKTESIYKSYLKCQAGDNVIKLFLSVIYTFSQSARVFVPDKLFSIV
jgi:hypothetical protein